MAKCLPGSPCYKGQDVIVYTTYPKGCTSSSPSVNGLSLPLSSTDIYYAGPNLPNSEVETLNTLTLVLQKIDVTLSLLSDTVWGDITGTLSDQTDLQAELDLKSDIEVSTIALTSELSFIEDSDLFQTGGTHNFTLAVSGNVNGVGRYIRINLPVGVTFSGDFVAHPDTAVIDPTKLNVILLIYFDNWDGLSTAKVMYKNTIFTAV